MKKKTMYIIVCAVVITVAVGGVAGYCYQQNKVKAAEKQVELKKQQKQNEVSIKKAYERLPSIENFINVRDEARSYMLETILKMD